MFSSELNAQSKSTATPSSDDPVLKACIECSNRLTLAETVLTAVQQQLAASRDIITAKDKIISQQDGIIARYEKMDVNSQKVVQIDDRATQILQEQIADDKRVRAELQSQLNSCRTNQKYYFVAGLGIGGIGGYKFGQAATLQSPFNFNSNAVSAAQQDFLRFSFSQTRTEERIRQAIKNVGKH